ncbi:MAG: M1 family metallopeptidase [Flavobacterium sp.]|jgi:aminopeptidase N|nr:M1 family metallopeptidase [Flavobacterium sp.]
MKLFRFITALFFINLSFAQQIDKVDFIQCDAFVTPNFSEKSISGTITYEFKVLKTIDTIRIDAKNMNFSNVTINGKAVNFKNSGKTLDLYEGFKKGKNQLTFNYEAKPKQTLYFVGNFDSAQTDNFQIWTQGQGKYTSHWLPSFDDVNEKVIFNLNVSFETNSTIISNGIHQSTVVYPPLSNPNNIWNFRMQKPMSSYLVMLAIGNFEKQTTTTKSGTPLEFYLDKNDVSKFEPTYRYSKELFDYLEQEIGVKYPWQIYRQVPVRDFLYAGMENTTSTVFSQDFVVDSIGFNDRNYVNVNAHELAHQWFGDLVTAKESKHHWLQEGFATYYALLAERHLFGDDYFYYQLWDMAEQLAAAAKEQKTPILDAKASSLTFYKKGAWALHVLRSEIGAKKFNKAVKNYLKKYAYKNVDTDDFLAEIKKVSGYDVQKFKHDWLENPDFQMASVQSYFQDNRFILELKEVKSRAGFSFFQNKEFFKKIMQSDSYFPVKQEILYQLETVSWQEKKEIIQLAMQTNDLKVRQTVVETIGLVPSEFETTFSSLLEDKSYVTREIALIKLWRSFPDKQLEFIKLSENWEGLNQNLKLAHLTLKLATPAVSLGDKKQAIDQLIQFTKSPNEAQLRQEALGILLNFKIYTDEVLISLLDASMHHKWQLVSFAKNEIRTLLKEEKNLVLYQNLLPKLSKIQQERLAIFTEELK